MAISAISATNLSTHDTAFAGPFSRVEYLIASYNSNRATLHFSRLVIFVLVDNGQYSNIHCGYVFDTMLY